MNHSAKELPPRRPRQRARVSKRLWYSVQVGWLAVVLVVVWWVTSSGSDSLYYPPLADIVEVLREEFISSRISETLLPSLRTLALAFSLAVVVGVIVGYSVGRTRFARTAIAPIFDLCRSTPVIALIPASIALLGIGSTSEIALIAWACVWPILLSTIDGVARIETGYRDSARSMRLSRMQLLQLVYLPAAAPQILAGINTSIAIGITAMVAFEMFSATQGLGEFLTTAQRNFDISASYAGAIVAGLVGYVIGMALRIVERRWILRWHFDMRRTAR